MKKEKLKDDNFHIFSKKTKNLNKKRTYFAAINQYSFQMDDGPANIIFNN